MNVLANYEMLVRGVRTALLYLGLAIAVICAVDWAVRTRRISPFNKISRFFRTTIDPLLAPIERVIVRAGGLPSAAAWWALVLFVVLGILLLALLDFIHSILVQAVFMVQQPSTAPPILVHWVFSILIIALLVRVISTWLPISPYSRWIRWSYVLTDWMVRPMSRVIPRIGMFDITPIVLWFLLQLAEKVVVGAMM
ncbi:MAG TPA: YggT family protein [Gemmatimonadaceae bacterium]|nr:YggT family protein [Gemmatimonadaceae bacterium]